MQTMENSAQRPVADLRPIKSSAVQQTVATEARCCPLAFVAKRQDTPNGRCDRHIEFQAELCYVICSKRATLVAADSMWAFVSRQVRRESPCAHA